MSFSDDILLAYADGELDHVTRMALEQAMQRDALLARRVAQFRAQRRVAQSQPQRRATVVQLADVRATRAATQQAERKARKLMRWSWREWGALGAVLLLGLVAGRFLLSDWQPEAQAPAGLSWRDGALLAQGRLALALEQAASGNAGGTGAAGPVRIAASFVSTDGTYCRSFTASSAVQDMAGVACRSGGVWKLAIWQQVPRPPGGARPPQVRVPAAVLAVVEQRSAGQLLDAGAEAEAMRRGWLR